MGKCSNDLKKEFLENYGKGSLRNIIKKKKGGREVKGFNDKEIANGKIDPENGYWIVTLTEQEQWSGKKLNYNHLWLYEVLANYKKIRWCHDTLKPVIYYKKDKDLIKKPGSLHVISSGPETGRSVEIFRLLRDISPELLIIENADELISDIRYHGSSSSELLKYLQEAKHTTLLFSTNSEMRQFYGLHSDQNVLSSTGCTIHTLDSFSLLKWMESQSNESKYPSPLSSQLKEIISDREYRINTTYIEVPKLTEFFTKAFTLIDTLDRDVARNIRYYLRRVISSPLNIIGGDYDNPEYMTAQRGFGSIEITYDTICGDLEMSAFEGLIQSNIPKQFKQIFVDNFLPEPFCNSNPLRESMIDTAKELLEGDSEAYVTVVVHYNDIKGFKRIMEKEEMFPEQFSSRFMITGWKGLSSSGALIDDGCRHYVISSQYPSLGYSLRRSGVTEFIFISDQKGLEGIKEIINRRLLDTIAYPIVIPEDGDSIPELLREGFEATDVPKTDRMIELYSDIDDEFISFSGWKQPLSSGKQEMDVGHDSILSGLEPGEEAFLCFNDENTGIFIPIGRSVMIKDDGFFKDVTTDNSKSDAMIFRSLIGKDVILSRSGLYLSFRTIFFRFMMKNGKRMTFWKQPYMWKGFEDLFNATIEWIRLIEKTADEYAKKTSINREEALVIIASKLTEAGITATDPGTVIGWCTHCEDITIDSGTYRVYKTEHPFRCEDLRIILHVLSNLVPGAIPKKTDPDRIFAAALCLQNLRQKVLKYKSDSGDQTSLNIRAGLARELQGIVSDAEIFRPIAVQRIKLIKSVEPMRCIPKFTDYI
ncbi:MAG: hypothetical protein APR53_03515 [Methanoculleus sp. SDB]|nr:MAG: hypothetical protein APR53_03515 [Methanoculleus sp. SDB]